ncbi:MAG: hypothetical protein P1S60_07420, partial [Anaerolineae bacterium]|nr:hypothetical protein [Anaerolineae bacterium]
EFFNDPLGDARVVIHSPFGGRVNGPWGLALTGALRQRMGVDVEVETNDNGILLRLLDTDADFPLDIITDLGSTEAREIILRELPDSAVFGSRFRQNAARALLLPGIGRGRRTPYWLQRLRARDLLQVVRSFDDFPIIAETYRDCLQDVMDVPHLVEVIDGISAGEIEVVAAASFSPSPVAQSLLWDFINIRMYEDDAPRAEQQLQKLAVNRDLLQDLLQDVALDELLRPEAIHDIQGQLQHTLSTSLVRTREELAVLLQQMGDLSPSEAARRANVDPSGWIAHLSGEMRLVGMDILTARGADFRWVAAEYEPEYRTAFQDSAAPELDVDASRMAILTRFLNVSGPVTEDSILARYAFPVAWLRRALSTLVESRHLVHGRFSPRETRPDDKTGISQDPSFIDVHEYVVRSTLEQIHRRTMSILRREVKPVPLSSYADFLAHWQHLAPGSRASGPGSLASVLQQLRAAPLLGRIWERDVLPLRMPDFDPGELEVFCAQGEVVWVGSGGTDPHHARIRFLFRGEGYAFLDPAPDNLEHISAGAQVVFAFIRSEGAVFFTDIVDAVEMPEKDVETALIELVLGELVTNDQVDTIRQLVFGTRSKPTALSTPSAFEKALAERRQEMGLASRSLTHRPGRAQYRSAKRRVGQRLEQQFAPAPKWTGRWAPVHRFGVMGKSRTLEEIAERQTRQLLLRHGVVTFDSLADETGSWDWTHINRQLQRMEMRGEVRRGYFVTGLPGVQYALPDVVEQLRQLRYSTTDQAPLVLLNAADPANIYGPQRHENPVMADGKPLSFSRIASNYLVLHRGIPLLVAENTGATLKTLQGTNSALVEQAVKILFNHVGSATRRITVESWNGQSVLDSDGVALLEAVGCYRAYPGMEWEKT